MGKRAVILAFLILGLTNTLGQTMRSQYDDMYTDGMDEPIFSEEDDEDGKPYEEPFWYELAARVQRNIDTEGLLRARRWGNVANGVLLGATGPVTFIVSAISLRLANAVLSVYLTAMGVALAGLELSFVPVAPWIVENLSYLSTQRGKTMLLTVAGGLAWAFGRAGLLPAILTCANALFNAHFERILAFISADDEDTHCGEAAALEPGEPAAFATDRSSSGWRAQADQLRREPTTEELAAQLAAADSLQQDPLTEELAAQLAAAEAAALEAAAERAKSAAEKAADRTELAAVERAAAETEAVGKVETADAANMKRETKDSARVAAEHMVERSSENVAHEEGEPQEFVVERE